ncbi:hypothetical protein V8G54_025468 [Vigna mungo]|uniref:Rab-GAP TBC domain-containing protein n=1 Tax=Vigna mungo TaxID=3915 RepID=A0AAQ3MYD8_VIGMU
MWRDPGVSADSFYEIRPECTDVPISRFKIKAGKTLSARKWHAAFTPEGYLDIGKTLSRIYRGCHGELWLAGKHKGVHPSIRGEVWEFLLGCYDPKSTFEERDQIRHRRRMQYATLKEECRQLFPLIGSGRFVTAPVVTEDGHPIQDPLVLKETNSAKGLDVHHQDNNNHSSRIATNSLQKVTDKIVVQWLLTLHQIGLDVVRTDRTLVFYEKQENLSKLWDVLAVYAWVESQFLIISVLEFVKRGNFRCTESSVGVTSQLNVLASVTQVIDPKLHNHLDNLGGGDYLFAFRMLMVLFRREFSFCDSLYLWEMMWALEYDPDLFLMYEMPESASEKAVGSKGKSKSIRQCGKYEREFLKSGSKNASQAPLPISVFLVASVLKDKSSKLLQEARGLDDVVKAKKP